MATRAVRTTAAAAAPRAAAPKKTPAKKAPPKITAAPKPRPGAPAEAATTAPSEPLSVFRIHPAIGIARVGNSDEHVIAPETMAGHPVPGEPHLTGGLPIRAGTEAEPVRGTDLRDGSGALKRLAARFRIHAYPEVAKESWPRGDGVEVTIGSVVGERTVADIVWTVHVANKKANAFQLAETGLQGIASYADGHLPPLRNPSTVHAGAPQPHDKIAVQNDPQRVRQLTIDPGPRVVSGRDAAPVHFDRPTPARWCDPRTGDVVTLDRYPTSFPADSFPALDAPSGPIDTLGEIRTDDRGRLLVLGGNGRAAGWRLGGRPAPLGQDVNNDQWFDDTSDGPVSATIVFTDGTRAEVHGAWVTTTDPAYAPQILNSVSLWDDVYDSWVRQLRLAPAVYDADRGGYQSSYRPTFDDQVRPVFASAALQQWVTNLDRRAMAAHAEVAKIKASDDPATTPLAGISAIFRDPDRPQQHITTLMPLALGDAGESFLTLRRTQLFFLKRWNEGRGSYRPGSGPALGPGEHLDKATLVNCLGGRFSPGIDLTFVMREPALYDEQWETSGGGPFRVKAKPLAYATATRPDVPLLTGGYVPRHVQTGLEPGDLSKFMAVPWHTDYNSCSTHPPSPNPAGNRTVFWSWPAQRPVAVYTADDVTWGSGAEPDASPPFDTGWLLGAQRWSVRGAGTDSTAAERWGRYQDRLDVLAGWSRIGVVLQATQIDHDGKKPLPPEWYLETAGRLVDTGRTPVEPYPNIATSVGPQPAGLDARQLFYKLFNESEFPEVGAEAKAYTDACLRWAQDFSDQPMTPADRRFFRYTEAAFDARLDGIYQQLVDEAADFDPAGDGQFPTYEDMCTYTIQWAPFNLIDGAWLRNIGGTGPMDEVESLLYSVSMDERGDGVISMNHCNIYLDLCHSIGYYPPPVESREFAEDPQLLDSAFTVPAFQMAISHHSDDYFPELIGMTLMLEWEVVQLKQTRDAMIFVGIDPHFYVMHIGIDNAVNGHGRRAVDAVKLYLQQVRQKGGDVAVQAAWRRIWNGFVAFSSLGSFGQDLVDLVTHKPDLRAQVIKMIEAKAEFGSRNHQRHMVGPSRIDEWFADPPGFLDALVEHRWLIPGDWAGCRFRGLLDFETGPMYRVFTDEEIDLWEAYTLSLGRPTPPPPPPQPPSGRAMAAVIDQLRPIQAGTAGHATNTLLGPDGVGHSLAWWFRQPTHELMEALVDGENGLVVPGDPGASRFYMELIAPTGPMGSIFDLPADPPNRGTCRDVVHTWIKEGCDVPEAHRFTLRLNTPRAVRDLHPTGHIHGMGNVH